jgi:uncharacterized protein with NRDE domain
LTRAAAPPTRLEPGEAGVPPLVAPQDLEAGGTWMGLNAPGVFVALTNRPTEARDPARRSRGLLVLDALRHASAAAVAAEMERVAEQSYNPFNLLYGDGRETFVTRAGEDGLSTRPLSPGAHVLCNRDIDDGSVPKVARIQSALTGIDPAAPLRRIVDRLAALLRSHADPERTLDNVCVHARERGYGTRSSAIWALGPGRRRLWYADGAPCETKFRNYTALLEDLQT